MPVASKLLGKSWSSFLCYREIRGSKSLSLGFRHHLLGFFSLFHFPEKLKSGLLSWLCKILGEKSCRTNQVTISSSQQQRISNREGFQLHQNRGLQ